jgi:hypothetical protein
LICVTDRPSLDERFEELVQRVAQRSTAPPPATIRRRARRRLAGQSMGAVLLVAAVVAAGLAVDRRLGAPPAPAGPAVPVPSSSPPPTSLAPVPPSVTRAGSVGGGRVVAAGISRTGMRWQLKARLGPGRGLCDSFLVAPPGMPLELGLQSDACGGPEKEVTVTYGESGRPGGNVPAAREMAVHGEVAGRVARVGLALKRQPRDHRSPVAGTVTARPVHAPGFQVGFFVAFVPVDTWVARITLYDARGRQICSQLGDDMKTPYLPGATRCS